MIVFMAQNVAMIYKQCLRRETTHFRRDIFLIAIHAKKILIIENNFPEAHSLKLNFFSVASNTLYF